MEQQTVPQIFGLFQKRVDGDDALLRLAQARFSAAGLGAELYAESASELTALLKFTLPDQPVTVHLRRGMSLFEERCRDSILDFAGRFRGRIRGLVVHDQPEAADCAGAYTEMLADLDQRLGQIENPPLLFVEYAAGIQPRQFIDLMESLQRLSRISCCIDIGHIGLWQARTAFAERRSGLDIFSITPAHPGLTSYLPDIQSSVNSALATVLSVVKAAGALRRPVHFHLHDAHPLSAASPFGIFDHISFLDLVPVQLGRQGSMYLPTMFGPAGLRRIVEEALHAIGPEHVSLSLEIHFSEGRLPLGDDARLFSHWSDLTNAERMNYWLWTIIQNARLVREAL